MIATPLFKKPAAAVSGGYQRPADWIAMPSIDPSEQKVAALFLVGDNNSNFIAFSCSGAYTVDWGDGNTENIASNTTAQHNYVFSDLSASTEFGPTGSKSRQAMIVITPQAGQSLTAISFNYRHSALSTTYNTPILEILLAAPNCTSLLISGSTNNLRLLEQCTILSHNTTSMIFMFFNCYALQSVPLFDTSSVTNMSSMFQNSSSLQTIPALDCSTSTNMTNFAHTSYGLKRSQATGIKVSTSFANCTLGPDELNEIYTNLATVTGQTITVSGNYGTASDNPSIATAKGWTVTG